MGGAFSAVAFIIAITGFVLFNLPDTCFHLYIRAL